MLLFLRKNVTFFEKILHINNENEKGGRKHPHLLI